MIVMDGQQVLCLNEDLVEDVRTTDLIAVC